MIKKGQTTTEYLVLLAVAIIIGGIVIGILGGIPSLGSSDRASNVEAQLGSISISQTQLGPRYASITIQNNADSLVTISNMTMAGLGCYVEEFPLNLKAYGKRDLKCYGSSTYFTSDTKFDVKIIFENTKLGATYFDEKLDVGFDIVTSQPFGEVFLFDNENSFFYNSGNTLTLADMTFHSNPEWSTSSRLYSFNESITNWENYRYSDGDNFWINLNAPRDNANATLLSRFIVVAPVGGNGFSYDLPQDLIFCGNDYASLNTSCYNYFVEEAT